MRPPDGTGAGERNEAPQSRIYVVDRREAGMLVMVDDDDRPVDIAATHLPKACRAEGAVVRVPIGEDGAPAWGQAKRDRAEERRRLAEMAKRVKRLRRSDPGGDIVL